MTAISPDDPTTRLILRHLLATIAYRAARAVRDTPPAFGDYRQTPDSPSSADIVAHMGDLMEWLLRLVRGEWQWAEADTLPWEQEVARFFRTLKAVDDELAAGAPIKWDPAKLIQGGLADALTHTGQLAMLRRLSGDQMQGESYARAEVVIGRVGLDQAPPVPRHEFT
jgi:AcrR family transcriptional regulator